MSEPNSPFNELGNLPPEALQFILAQQAIHELCGAVEQDTALKSKLEATENPEDFVAIATEHGYRFSVIDLQALRWAVENAPVSSDEFDDYELNEEDLEMVAGGRRRSVKPDSYFHFTGIRLHDNRCFHYNQQSPEMYSQLVWAMENMERWEFNANGTITLKDQDKVYKSYVIGSGIGEDYFIYDGKLPGK
ncbi:MAG TPA: hypothetical protein DDZ80_06615 [Cyanobacteria bacterium UBA8803]|nr:hypothetical protein [Cyanobacteria bacterium UBA9273]HBL58197.1 hypothetical protein [Cyanobacteria bacterium UBA8803]